MYVCIARRQHPPAKKKEKEKEKGRKAAFRVVFLEMGTGGKNGGTVDKIVSHTFSFYRERVGRVERVGARRCGVWRNEREPEEKI